MMMLMMMYIDAASFVPMILLIYLRKKENDAIKE